MGLFSEKKTVVSSQTISLIEKDPRYYPTVIQRAILGGSDLASTLRDAAINSIGNKAKAYYRYGRDSYILGLPMGTFMGYYVSMDDVKTVMDRVTGRDSTILDAKIAIPDGKLFISSWLTENGYNPDTKELVAMAHSFYTYFFKEAVVSEIGKVKITYIEKFDNPNPMEPDTSKQLITYLNVADAVPNESYCVVKYTIPHDSAEYTWYTQMSLNLYPELNPENTDIQKSPYFPIVPVRENNVTSTFTNKPKLAKSSKHLLNKLGLNYGDIISGVDANPDIGQVDHAYIVIGLKLNSTEQAALNYLFEYFSYLENVSTVTEAEDAAWVFGTTYGISNQPPVNQLEVRCNYYRILLAYRYINKSTVTGSIGKVGTVTQTLNVVPQDVHISTNGPSLVRDNSELILRKQINDTQYVELLVKGPHHINYVYNGYGVDTNIKILTENEDNNNFIIPLNRYIFTEVLSQKEQIAVMYSALNITFNSYEVVKLKWYQTGLFQFIMVIITVALTIYGFGYIANSIRGMTMAAAATFIAQQVAIGVVISVGLQFAIKILGLEATVLAVLIMVAAIVYSGYGPNGAGSLEGVPWADEILKVASGLPEAVKKYSETMLKKISQEMTDFQDYAQKLWDDLEDKWDAIKHQSNLDPIGLFYLTDYYPGENPGTYMDRHIHTGNPGVESLNAIGGYVDNMLDLGIR